MTERQREMLPLEERQRLLIEASEQYMRGEIDIDQLENAERLYMPDYGSVIRELARARGDIVRRVQRFFANQQSNNASSEGKPSEISDR